MNKTKLIVSTCAPFLVLAIVGSAERVPTGPWGGDHIKMEVTDRGARIEYDCGRGTISHEIVVSEDGEFVAKGTHIQERGGPQRENEPRDGKVARYLGRTNGKSMTLTVTLPQTDEIIGTFSLEYGKEPRLTKCL